MVWDSLYHAWFLLGETPAIVGPESCGYNAMGLFEAGGDERRGSAVFGGPSTESREHPSGIGPRRPPAARATPAGGCRSFHLIPSISTRTRPGPRSPARGGGSGGRSQSSRIAAR